MQSVLETGLSNALIASLLALLAFAFSRLGRPALAHGLWLLVLLKLLTPALMPISLPWPAEQAAVGTALPSQERVSLADLVEWDDEWLDATTPSEVGSSLPAKTGAPAIQQCDGESTQDVLLARWCETVAALWLGGSAVWFACTVFSVCRFQRLIRSARPAPAELRDQLQTLAARMGLVRCPRVYLVPGVVSPMIWSFGTAPRLLFPSRLLGQLDREQRAAVLLHELAHVRRRDHWVRLVEMLAVGLYWWHPVVWWARRQLREAEEQCCDAWVVWASSDNHAYAKALLQTVAFVSRAPSPLPVGASGIGQGSQLRRRLVMIMRGDTPKSLSATGWLVLLVLALFLLPVAAQAQQPKNEEREREIKALKEQARFLEEGNLAQKVKVNKLAEDEQSEEVQEALQAAAQLKRQIAERRRELEAMEAKLSQILDKLDGKKGGKRADEEKVKVRERVIDKDALKEEIKERLDKERGRIEVEIKRAKEMAEKERGRAEVEIKRAKEMAERERGRAEVEIKRAKELAEKARSKAMEDLQAGKIQKGISVELKDKLKKDPKAANLEQRLDRLLKEIEELRQEIRGEKAKPERR